MLMNMAFLMLFAGGGSASRWNVDQLKQTPSYQVVSLSPAAGVTSLVYESIPINGTNTEVFAYYGVPAGPAPEGGWPAVVCAHGGGGTAYYDWVKLWNSRGYAAIAMDLEGNRPEWASGLTFNKIRMERGGPVHLGVFADWQEPLEKQWFYHATAQIMLAHSLVRSFPEINPEKTGITGISWGGILTCTVAGLDDRFKFAIPVYGCGFLPESDGTMGVSLRGAGDGRAEWVAANMDPANFLPAARCPILWVNGSNDPHFPMPVFQKSADLVTAPVFFRYEIAMNHSHPAGWTPPEIYLFADSMVKGADSFPVIRRPEQTGNILQAGIEPGSIAGAALCYTVDSGEWLLRKWYSVPASVGAAQLEGVIPPGSTAAFFNCTNQSGLAVSSPFVTLIASTNESQIYEGFGYGALTNFTNNVPNPDAAGGIGLAPVGWKQFNTNANYNGLVFNNDAASLLTPAGYSLTKTNGYMSVARGTNTSATWALRDITPSYAMNVNTTYWFSVVIRNMDNSIWSVDASYLAFRASNTNSMLMGFDNSEKLLISLGGVNATGTDTNLFFKGNYVTVLGKLVLSSTGNDTLYVSAFKHSQTISGEPVSWDLSVTAELGGAVLNNLGMNVGSGNSNVNFDEIRMGKTLSSVTGIPEE
jgi:dienelactone hydrolase